MVNVAIAAEPPPEVALSLTTREEMEAYIRQNYPVQATDMIRVIECESHFDSTIGGDIRNGVPTSWGLSQIHLPAHPEVSKEEATDPEFAIRFMGEAFKNGKQGMWSCYRLTK